MKKQLGPNLIYRKQYNGEPIRKENQGMIMGAHRVVQQFYLRQVIPLSHPFASLLYSTLLHSTLLYCKHTSGKQSGPASSAEY